MLRQVLHIPICATCRAVNLSNNPAQFLDNCYFPRPLSFCFIGTEVASEPYVPMSEVAVVWACRAGLFRLFLAAEGADALLKTVG